MVFYTTDAAMLAGFAFASYRSLGRWLKYKDTTAKQFDGGLQMHTRAHARHASTCSTAPPQQAVLLVCCYTMHILCSWPQGFMPQILDAADP
jgi:hypothetical protein